MFTIEKKKIEVPAQNCEKKKRILTKTMLKTHNGDL